MKLISIVQKVYLVQVNAGGKWRDDDDIKLLISDIFSPFSVKSRCFVFIENQIELFSNIL